MGGGSRCRSSMYSGVGRGARAAAARGGLGRHWRATLREEDFLPFELFGGLVLLAGVPMPISCDLACPGLDLLATEASFGVTSDGLAIGMLECQPRRCRCRARGE